MRELTLTRAAERRFSSKPCRTLPAPRFFTNPILPAGVDPWVVRHEGRFFDCGSTDSAIFVGTFNAVGEMGANRRIVFEPPPSTPYSHEIWAPELHFLDGRWFIYFAADDGDNSNHRIWVLGAQSDDPQGEYELLGQLDTGGRWAIDGSVLHHEGQRYLIWSGWENNHNEAQNLYIARLENPWTIAGPRVKISEPQFHWENNVHPRVNEGPTALARDGRLFIIFSGSGSWTDHYCMGRLDFLGGEVLDPQNWRKHPEPVFCGTREVIAPGHASFFNDGWRDWMVYHAACFPGAGWINDIRLQPFDWNADGTPNFGAPLPPGVPIEY